MAAKTISSFSSCFTFLKEALVLPTQNPKLFTPVFFLLAITAFLVPLTNVLCIQPLTDDMTSHLIKIKNTDPSSAEYAKLLEEIKQDARELVLTTIVLPLVTLALNFVKQIVTCLDTLDLCPDTPDRKQRIEITRATLLEQLLDSLGMSGHSEA